MKKMRRILDYVRLRKWEQRQEPAIYPCHLGRGDKLTDEDQSRTASRGVTLKDEVAARAWIGGGELLSPEDSKTAEPEVA
jgi:hypothetical protein